jgi:ATP-dependent Clp protease, protease subunit
MKQWFNIRSVSAAAEGKPAKARIDIFDQIGESTDWWTGEKNGLAARDFSAALAALGDDIGEIELHINSPGGSVLDGWQIFNELRRHPAAVTAVIDGQAASMASIIAMAADRVLMPANATIWVHNPIAQFFAWTTGYAGDMRKIAEGALKLAEDLDIHGTALRQAYVDKAARTEGATLTADLMDRLMREETLITAARAVDLGLADAIELFDAVEQLDGTAAEATDWNMPARLAAMRPAAEQAAQRIVASARAAADLPDIPRTPEAIAAMTKQKNAQDAELAALRAELAALRPPPAAEAKAIAAALRAAGLAGLTADALDLGPTAEQLARLADVASMVRNACVAARIPDAEQAPIVEAAALAAMDHCTVGRAVTAALQAKLAAGDPDIRNHLPPGAAAQPTGNSGSVVSILKAREQAARTRR